MTAMPSAEVSAVRMQFAISSVFSPGLAGTPRIAA
jgi:hypothetical protein